MGTNGWTGINYTPRFKQCAPNYDEFAVTGLKLDWIPNNEVATSGQMLTVPTLVQMTQFEDLTRQSI